MTEMNAAGLIEVAGSKSIMARALIISSFVEGKTIISNMPDCEDTTELIRALRNLGFFIRISDSLCEIEPGMHDDRALELRFDGSATAMRFMLARLAVTPNVVARIQLDPQLVKRPHTELIDALKKSGADIEIDIERSIFIVKGKKLERLHLETSGEVSSQYVSAMMLAAPLTEEGCEIALSPSQVSLPYIRMTAGVMRDFGVVVEHRDRRVYVPGNQRYNAPDVCVIEPDASTAAFWAIASLMTGNARPIMFPARDSLQGDARFIDVLERMGAKAIRGGSTVRVHAESLHGIGVDMRDMPDCVPPLVVLALIADSPSMIAGVRHLRWKESNRIERLVEEVGRIGGAIRLSGDGIIVEPLQDSPQETMIHTGHDHRIAMAFAILALRFPQVTVDDPVCVCKSCRDFWEKRKRFQP